jgi:hypothetical protein
MPLRMSRNHPERLAACLKLWLVQGPSCPGCVFWWNMLGASNCRCSCTMRVLSASTRTLRRHLHTDRRLCLVPSAVPCLLLFAVCAPGRYGDTCAECVPGSYCPGGQDAPIVSCGSNRSSTAGAPSQASCYCAPGEPLCQPVSINSSCPPRSASQQFHCDWCVTLCAQLDTTAFKVVIWSAQPLPGSDCPHAQAGEEGAGVAGLANAACQPQDALNPAL